MSSYNFNFIPLQNDIQAHSKKSRYYLLPLLFGYALRRRLRALGTFTPYSANGARTKEPLGNKSRATLFTKRRYTYRVRYVTTFLRIFFHNAKCPVLVSHQLIYIVCHVFPVKKKLGICNEKVRLSSLVDIIEASVLHVCKMLHPGYLENAAVCACHMMNYTGSAAGLLSDQGNSS